MASEISAPDLPGGGVVPATVDSPGVPPQPLVAASRPSKPAAIDARFLWSTRAIRIGISFILIGNGNNAAGIFLPRYDSSKTFSKRELRAAVFTYAPPVGDCENRQENDKVVTQTAQHDPMQIMKPMIPQSTFRTLHSAGWQLNPVVDVSADKLRTRTIIARSLRRSKTNEIQTIDGVNQSTPAPPLSQ
jgi:hypothetical protein